MFRFLGLVSVCICLLGVVLSFHIPFHWIGHLPGDLLFHFNRMHVSLPLGSGLVLSLLMAVFLYLFPAK